jgi:ketosteroid isomerase-like protein
MRAVFKAWEEGDADALGDLFAEDGVYEDPLKERPLHGRDEIREGNRAAVAAIKDCAIRVDYELEQGPIALVVGYFASRLADGSGRLDFPFAALIEMSDGRIHRLTEFFDTRPLVP